MEKVTNTLNSVKQNRYITSYVKSVKPPYTKRDIVPVVATVVLILAMVLPIVFYKDLPYSLRRIFAATPDTTPPTKPQILVGTENPLQVPYTYAVQGSVYIYWHASTDTDSGVASYRVSRNGTKIGDTTNTNFMDTGVSGSVTYTIEAYDQAGNTADSTLHINLPTAWAASVSSSDTVISGFVINKTDNSPVSNTTISVAGQQPIHTTHSGYYFYIYPGGNNGSMQLNLSAPGYASDTENVTLTKGQSVNQIIYLTPQSSTTSNNSNNGNGNSGKSNGK